VAAERASLGRKLFEVPGYTFRAFVTDLALPPELIWLDYNRRADRENRIVELKHDLAAEDFCLHEFLATEAVIHSILLLFNLLGEFQRASRLTPYRRPATVRAQVFLGGALLGRARTVWSCICAPPGAACTSANRCWETSYCMPTRLHRS
jgi:hypothetical protein